MDVMTKEEKIQEIIREFFQKVENSLVDSLADVIVKAYELGFNECKNNMPKWKHWKDGIAGNGDGRQIYLTRKYGIYNVSSCLGCECDYIELSELDKL